MLKNHFKSEFELASWIISIMDYVQRLQMANLQLELDINAAQVNIVVAQAGCLSVCSSLVRYVCPSFAGDHDQPVPELTHHLIQPDLGQD